MVGVFLVAALVTLIAVVPALMLRVRSGAHGDRPQAIEAEETDYGEIAF